MFKGAVPSPFALSTGLSPFFVASELTSGFVIPLLWVALTESAAAATELVADAGGSCEVRAISLAGGKEAQDVVSDERGRPLLQ